MGAVVRITAAAIRVAFRNRQLIRIPQSAIRNPQCQKSIVALNLKNRGCNTDVGVSQLKPPLAFGVKF